MGFQKIFDLKEEHIIECFRLMLLLLLLLRTILLSYEPLVILGVVSFIGEEKSSVPKIFFPEEAINAYSIKSLLTMCPCSQFTLYCGRLDLAVSESLLFLIR